MSKQTAAKTTETQPNSQAHAPEHKRVPAGAFLSGPQRAAMALQDAAGNRAVGQLLGGKQSGGQRLGLQTKLKVNEPGDSYEQEADRVADQVMATPAHPDVSGAPPRIQRFSGQPTGQIDAAPASVDQTLASPGKPLEPALRQDMEQRFGYDFSRVRVHTGAVAEQSAQDVNAQAYTVGHDIVFGEGRFAPGTREGQRLIAHELTHVVQQSGMDVIRVGQSDNKRGQSTFPVSSNFQRPSLDSGMALQCAPIKRPDIKPIPALAPLEVVVREAADLILKNYGVQGITAGPVCTGVLDEVTGKIYIGLNSGIPPNITDVVAQGISAQQGRIDRGEVIVVRTDPLAKKGGHSEPNAVNAAVSAREALLHRKVTEVDLRTFKLHNIWLKGADRKFTAAPRCEHCARITRSMSVTSSVFFAEGGVSGTIKPPPRGQRRITPRVGPGGATGSVHGEITVPQPKTPLAPTTLPDKPAATPTTTTPKASAPTTAPAAPKSGSLTTGKVTVDYNLSSFDPKSAIKLKNIDLSDYPPEKKGPVSRFFNDRPVLAKFSSIAASQAINYANDKALELIESHFASALEDARKEFATRFPSRNSLFSSADINGRRKAYESAIAKLDRPRRLRIAAQVFVVLTTPDNKLDAAMRQVEQSLAGLGITADDVMNYLDAAFAYESVMIDLYEQVGRYSGELATLSIDVDLHLRAEVLWRCANDLDKSARSVAQLPFVAFAPGEQLVLTLWKLRDTFQGLGDGMDSFAWEIPARASEYDRLLKSLSSQLIRIGDQLDMWGTTYDTNKKRNTSTTRSRK